MWPLSASVARSTVAIRLHETSVVSRANHSMSQTGIHYDIMELSGKTMPITMSIVCSLSHGKDSIVRAGQMVYKPPGGSNHLNLVQFYTRVFLPENGLSLSLSR